MSCGELVRHSHFGVAENWPIRSLAEMKCRPRWRAWRSLRCSPSRQYWSRESARFRLECVRSRFASSPRSSPHEELSVRLVVRRLFRREANRRHSSVSIRGSFHHCVCGSRPGFAAQYDDAELVARWCDVTIGLAAHRGRPSRARMMSRGRIARVTRTV